MTCRSKSPQIIYQSLPLTELRPYWVVSFHGNYRSPCYYSNQKYRFGKGSPYHFFSKWCQNSTYIMAILFQRIRRRRVYGAEQEASTFSQVDPERRRSTRERLPFTSEEEQQRLYGAIISGLKKFWKKMIRGYPYQISIRNFGLL
jgi:hypothetical protein